LLNVAAAGCVFVGDARRDIEAARAAGMIAVGARFGYLCAADAPDSWPIHGWIDSPGELLPWFGLGAEAGT
jgi:phosphoglycolate phosphatase